MTIGCPSRSPSMAATIRATMSVVAPAGNGTIRRIGLSGQRSAGDWRWRRANL
jgi:hypothetical protein